jgi:hypothetical protein
MAIPKKLRPRVEKFIGIVLTKVVNEELDRSFFKKGKLDDNYTIALYSTGLLPLYNDNRIEIGGAINDKRIGLFILSSESLINRKVDDELIKELTEAFMKLRIKEIK